MANRPQRFKPPHRSSAAASPSQPLLFDGHRLGPRSRGYDAQWDKASLRHRRAHPECGYCLAGVFGEVRDEPATRVDHLYPQRRFPGVFWEEAYWVSSCDQCDAAKQALEHGTRAGLDDLATRLDLTPLRGVFET